MAMQNSGSGPLQMGSRGPGVAAVQGQLNALLMPSPRLVADDVFGMKTSQAVKQFQQRCGLTADGIVGPKTAAALGTLRTNMQNMQAAQSVAKRIAGIFESIARQVR